MTKSISVRLLVKDHCSLTVILKSKLEKIYFFIHKSIYILGGCSTNYSNREVKHCRRNGARFIVFQFQIPKAMLRLRLEV
jgi:hypothetical protein